MLNSRNITFISFILVAFTVLLIAKPSLAQSKKPIAEVPNTETPGFTIDKGMSQSIYEQSTSKALQESEGLAFESSLRIFFPTDFSLKNKYFNVPYAENTPNIVGVLVGPQLNLATLNRFDIDAYLRAGYAYSQGIYEVESESGLDVKDTIELQWIPFLAGFDISSKPFFSNRMTAGLFSSLGIDWYTQSGKLDGMNQTFWVPRFECGASMTLIDGITAGSSGFNGIRLSTISYQSFASKQINRGWATDIGARYAF